jgi:hypothetical protein
MNNTHYIVFRAPVDEYRARKCRARVGSYCTRFQKLRFRWTTKRSSVLPEASLCSAMKILGHEFLPEHFQFTVCKMIDSSTFITYNSAVLQSYPAVIQFHSHTLQFYSSTVIPCSYTVPRSYPAVIQFHSTLQFYNYTVIFCSYIFLSRNL